MFSVSSFDCSSFSVKIGPSTVLERDSYAEKFGMLVAKAFDHLYYAVETTYCKFRDKVIKPFFNRILKPILRLISKTFNFIISNGKHVMKGLNKWIFTPAVDNILKPLGKIVKKSFNFIFENLKSFTQFLSNWTFKPLVNYILNPAYQQIKNVFSRIANGLTEYVFKPISEKVLPPLWRCTKQITARVFKPLFNQVIVPCLKSLKTGIVKTLTTLNNWIFKPIFNQLGDLFHGIYRRATMGPEISKTEIYSKLNIALDVLDNARDKQKTSEPISNIIEVINSLEKCDTTNKNYFIAKNCALAILLEQRKPGTVISEKWISETEVTRDLSKLTKRYLPKQASH